MSKVTENCGKTSNEKTKLEKVTVLADSTVSAELKPEFHDRLKRVTQRGLDDFRFSSSDASYCYRV